MNMLDNATAVVFSTDDLRDAVSSDNGVEYVYFGADITLAYGITIYPNKPSLTFDGTYEGVRHTFTDMNSSDLNNTIGVRSVSNIIITFQNINLIGRNFYGIPYVPNSSSYYGVSTIYHNVTYSGTQITHNPYGFARFTDCDITVNNNEVAEVSRLEIGGVTSMVKTNLSDAVFWFYGSSARRPYLKILSGAQVTITTAHYFMYESYPPDYTIEPGASLTLNTNSGIAWDSAHTVASFLVGEGASFRYAQAVNARSVATLYLDGALTVSEGADFYMQANFVNTNRLIWFTGSSGGLYINNPKSFALYSRGTSSAAEAFYFTSATPFTFTGGQVNFWSSAMNFPTAGTFGDIPQRKWNRPDWSQFTLRGTANTSRTNTTFNDFTEEELGNLPALSDLQLHSAKVFSLGNLRLAVNTVVVGGPITGRTEPYANVKAEYTQGGTPYSQIVFADGAGFFSIAPPTQIPFATSVTVSANTPFLIIAVTKISEDEELSIVEAPNKVKFITPPIAGFSDIILRRQITDAPVTVWDTRINKTRWALWASITDPLKTDENDILYEAVVFVDPDETLITLGTEPRLLQTYDAFYGDTKSVDWNTDRGVLARITVPIRSGKEYSTRLIWEIYPEGVQPERRS